MINNFFTVDYALGILITLAIVFTILIITVIVNKFLTSYKKSKEIGRASCRERV